MFGLPRPVAGAGETAAPESLIAQFSAKGLPATAAGRSRSLGAEFMVTGRRGRWYTADRPVVSMPWSGTHRTSQTKARSRCRSQYSAVGEIRSGSDHAETGHRCARMHGPDESHATENAGSLAGSSDGGGSPTVVQSWSDDPVGGDQAAHDVHRAAPRPPGTH